MYGVQRSMSRAGLKPCSLSNAACAVATATVCAVFVALAELLLNGANMTAAARADTDSSFIALGDLECLHSALSALRIRKISSTER